VRVNDLKIFQRNPLKPFWPPLTIQREFDAYVLSLRLIRYDLPDPTSKPACRAVIECAQASSSEYHGNLFSYLGHKQLLNSIVRRIGNRHRRRKAKKGVRTLCTFGMRRRRLDGAAKRIENARAVRQLKTVSDLARRAQLDRQTRRCPPRQTCSQHLPATGAKRCGSRSTPYRTKTCSVAKVEDETPEADVPSEAENFVADYRSMGLTLG
jgi:hypothetical protein